MTENQIIHNTIDKLIYFVNSEEPIQFNDEHYSIRMKYSNQEQTLYYELTNQVNNKTNQFEIEGFILGGWLISAKVINDCIDRTEVILFKDIRHKIIFRGMHELFGNSDIINTKSLIEILGRKNQLLAAGGKPYIESLIEDININSNFPFLTVLIEYYAKTVQLNFNKNVVFINIPPN